MLVALEHVEHLNLPATTICRVTENALSLGSDKDGASRVSGRPEALSSVADAECVFLRSYEGDWGQLFFCFFFFFLCPDLVLLTDPLQVFAWEGKQNLGHG